MTAFLICLIIFIFIFGYQKIDAAAKETEYKKSNTTNVKLEQEVRQKWFDETEKKLDHVRPDVKSLYKFLVDYIEDCGLPYIPFAYSPEERQTTYAADKERSDAVEAFSDKVHLKAYAVLSAVSWRNYPKILAMSDGERTAYFNSLGEEEIANRHKMFLERIKNFRCIYYIKYGMEWAKYNEEYCVSSTGYLTKINDHYSVVNSKLYTEDENLVPSFIAAFGTDCPPLPNTPPKELYSVNRTLKERLYNPVPKNLDMFAPIEYPYPCPDFGKPNEVSHYLYCTNLVNELTRREMSQRGYKLSPDGVHESEWQEAEKRHQMTEEDKKKYPWLFK